MQPAVSAPIDPRDLALAATEYRRLRRRYWQFVLVALASAAFLVPAITYQERMNRTIAGALGMFGALLGVIAWAGMLVTWLTLMNWRCPRCGKRFIMSFTSTWPTNNCKHCGLYLPRVTAA